MVRAKVSCNLIGEKFSPGKLEKKIKYIFNDKIEVGDIGLKGRYKDKPIPYGSVEIYPPEELRYEHEIAQLDWIIEFLEKNKVQISKSNIDDIKIMVSIFYETQCDMSFDSELLKRIGDLKLDLNICCFNTIGK
ncbi:MAG: hypothetical protein EPN82_04080 [Bacteroidetes bacterium]|nr:MAG: hypothetical protein EPN82_04080 [Bacteroidota bacterium]